MDPQRISHIETLISLRRYREAGEAIRQMMQESGSHPHLLSMLTVTQLHTDRLKEARNTASSIISSWPQFPYGFYLMGEIEIREGNLEAARQAARTAVQLDPYDPHYHVLLGRVAYSMDFFDKALEIALHALSLNPGSGEALELKSLCELQLNRTGHARETSREFLKQMPANAAAHNTRGWVLLHSGKFREAEEAFREGLRLDPTNATMRVGLKQALRTRMPVFNLMLRYQLWISKFGRYAGLAIGLGAYAVMRLMESLYSSEDGFPLPVILFGVAYILFVYSSWLAMPLANLYLMFHKDGKLALDHDERLSGILVGVLLGSSLAILAAGFISGYALVYMLAGFLAVMSIPVAGLFATDPGTWWRRMLVAYALVMAGSGILLLLALRFELGPLAQAMSYLFGVLMFAYGFVHLGRQSTNS